MSYEAQVKSVILKALEGKEEAKETSSNGFIFEAKVNPVNKNGFSINQEVEITVSKVDGKKSVLKTVLTYDGVQNVEGFAKFSGDFLAHVL